MKTLHLSIIIVVTLTILISSHTVFAFATDIVVQTASFNGKQGTYAIPYNMTNGKLVASLLDLPAKEFIFIINATGDDKLTVELSRKIIDSTRDVKDKPYLVYVCTWETGLNRIKANEIQNDNKTRTLVIDFTKRDNLIGIVGTYFIENNSTAVVSNTYGDWIPLQQYNKGFDAQYIICKQGLQLVIKSEDETPACVKPQTAQKLVERGWGTMTSAFLPSSNNSTCKYSTFENATMYVVVDPQERSNPAKVHISSDILDKYPKLKDALQHAWYGVNMAIVVSPGVYLSDITEGEAKGLLGIWSSHFVLEPTKTNGNYMSRSYDLAVESAGSFYHMTITETYKC